MQRTPCLRRRPRAARPLGLALVLALGSLVQPACRREPARVLVIDARTPTPAQPAAQAPAATQAPAPLPAADPAPAAAPAPTEAPKPAAATPGGDAAVEITGAIQLPPGASQRQRFVAMIALGDCLSEGAKLLRRVPITDDGTFFSVVFAAPGSTLTVCAAAEAAPGKPTALYGKVDKSLAIGPAGEQEFRDLSVVLAPSPTHTFGPSLK
jgi:hypothetical protein